MARPHCGINFCTTAKIRSDCFWTFGLNKKNIISTKSEQLSLKMETYFSPKREEKNNFVFEAIGLANPNTGKISTHI